MLRQFVVLENRPDTPLLAAVNSIKSERQLAVERARANLKKHNFPIAKLVNSDDVFVALAMMEDFSSSILPSRDDQEARYKMIKKSDLLCLGLRVIRQWFDLSGNQVSGSILIKLAYCLRHTGHLEDALRVSEAVVKPHSRVSLSRGQKAVLATERAATLLDLFEIRSDSGLLCEARRCAGIAWAISKSDETRLVYHRLKKLGG